MTLLMLIRQFLIDWFKIPFLGEAETVISIKSWFNDMGHSESDPFWAFCLFINSTDQFLLIQIISASTLVCVVCVYFAAVLRLLESVYSRQGKYYNYVICV